MPGGLDSFKERIYKKKWESLKKRFPGVEPPKSKEENDKRLGKSRNADDRD